LRRGRRRTRFRALGGPRSAPPPADSDAIRSLLPALFSEMNPGCLGIGTSVERARTGDRIAGRCAPMCATARISARPQVSGLSLESVGDPAHSKSRQPGGDDH